MGDLEDQQRQYEKEELARTVALAQADRKLRKKIVWWMRQYKAFAGLREKECFDRWSGSYMEQRPGALKVLEKAREFCEPPDAEGF